MMRSLLLIILVFQFTAINAQQDVWIDARGKIGFLVAHRSIMGHLATEHAGAAEFSYRIQPKGKKQWHQVYNNPAYGLTGFIGTTGNRKLMGHYFGLYSFINFPFIKKKVYTFSGKLGIGLAYGTKVYDPEDEELIFSMAVGSHFNAHVCLALENRFEFGDHAFTAAIDMTHFSNGSSQVPNLGLNLPYLSLGYGYKLKSESKDSISKIYVNNRNIEFGAIGILSQKQIDPIGGRHYPVFALSLIGRKYFSPRAGLELSLDGISKQAIFGFQKDVPKTQSEIIQVGIFAGYIMPFDHLHLIFGMGYYLRDKYKPEDPVYHRVGMRYIFDNGINLNLVLKTHFARADYVEYGIGYTFKR